MHLLHHPVLLQSGSTLTFRLNQVSGGRSPDERPLSSEDLEELLNRIDNVPASLALAQSAEESGWGTSRFSDLGNAVFGQWTWASEGMQPTEQRAGIGDYRIANFETPLASVPAYMRNLNTHHAYKSFRKRRAELRARGEPIRGAGLVHTLGSYSERGQDYI